MRRQHAVECGRRRAAHDVAEHGGAQLEADHALVLLEVGDDLGRVLLDALGDHDDGVGLAALIGRAQPLRRSRVAGTSFSGTEMTSAPPASPAIMAM